MKRFVKRIIAAIFIGVMIMNLNGCIKFVPDEELAKSKLEEKYKQEFVIEKIQTQSIFEKYYTAIAYPTDNPGVLFRAYINMDGNGCSDNYVSKCVFKKVADTIGKNMDELNGYFYIYAVPASEDTGLTNPEMSVEEYLKKHKEGTVHVYLHYAPEKMDVNMLYRNLQNAFTDMSNANGIIHLSITDESGLDTIQDYIESTDKLYDDYDAIVKPYYVGNIYIKKGKLMCDKSELAKLVEGR